jgi:hypothetical protein
MIFSKKAQAVKELTDLYNRTKDPRILKQIELAPFRSEQTFIAEATEFFNGSSSN